MVLQINLCRIRGHKYYGITSTAFGTGTQNVRSVDFSNSANFNLLGNDPNKFLYINKVQSLSLPMIFISILH